MTRPRLAPAKLNLYLHVVGRRADGFHRLDSLIAFADIGDRLSVEPAAALTLDITGPFASELAGIAPPSNLVWRAAEGLARRLGRVPAVRIVLEKNLPVASGIGGGSSDAAAALRALLELWQARLDDQGLQDLALELGADVPACLFGKTCWLGGVGEEIVPAAPLPATWVVLANPRRALPTAAVFKARQGAYSVPARFAEPSADAAALVRRLADRRNDLADAARGLVPELDTVLARLAHGEGALLARMSGSGATCFGLFATPDAAHETARRIAGEIPGWWVASGKLL